MFPQMDEKPDMSWNRKFDHIFHIVNADAALQSIARKHETELVENKDDFIQTAAPFIRSIVEEALGRRAVRVEMLHKSSAVDEPQLTFGLVLSKHDFKDTLDRGPEANSAAAAKFIEFWGLDASKLRRFSDGSMAEGVAWKGETEQEGRIICGEIIRQALSRHAAVEKKSIVYVGNMWDETLKLQRVRFSAEMPRRSSTGEEYFGQISHIFSTLSSDLRKMGDLPLNIVSIRSSSPVLRSTAIFPPLPAAFNVDKFHFETQPFVESAPVQVVMEGSSKWPNDRNAIARLKTAFQLKMVDHLKSLDYFVTVTDVRGVRVWKDGYYFVVEVVYLGELPLSRKVVAPDGRARMEDTAEFLQIQEKLDLSPKLASAISGVLGQEESYGTACRIAKRWICGQLMHHYVPEEAVELIMAQVFLRPQPFTTPTVPDVAFLRFLALIATHDWQRNPLIVDFKKDMTHTDIATIKAEFTKKRATLPLMTIATHFDPTSYWTRRHPSPVILKRLCLLAQISLEAADTARMSATPFDAKTIFRPPAGDTWDLLIHLKPNVAAHRYEALDLTDDPALEKRRPDRSSEPNRKRHSRSLANFPLLELKESSAIKADTRILLDFDPVAEYVAALRETFDDFAYFFNDPHGGTVVTVVWKTAQFKRVELDDDEDALAGRVTEYHGMGKRKPPFHLTPNVTAMVEDFSLMGKGLVSRVEARPEKWNI